MGVDGHQCQLLCHTPSLPDDGARCATSPPAAIPARA
jgi:hypothetical protein